MKTLISSAVLAIALCGSVYAEDTGYFYAGAAMAQVERDGYSKTTYGFDADVDANQQTQTIMRQQLSDVDETQWKAYAGYRVNRWLAVEGAYHNLGDYSYRSTTESKSSRIDPNQVESDTAPLSPSTVGYSGSDHNSSAISLSALIHAGITPDIEAFGKIGLANTDFENTLSHGTDGGESNLLLGVGANYRLSNNLKIRGEYERFNHKDLEDSNILSLGAQYNTL